MKIRLPIPPGDLAVNGRHVSQYDKYGKPTGRIISSSTYRAALDHASLVVRQTCIANRWETSKRQCRVSIVSHWPTIKGDLDGPLKGAIDALQQGGAIVDDRQVVELVARATWRSATPGIDMEIEEVNV